MAKRSTCLERSELPNEIVWGASQLPKVLIFWCLQRLDQVTLRTRDLKKGLCKRKTEVSWNNTSILYPSCPDGERSHRMDVYRYAAIAKLAGWRVPHAPIRPAYLSGCIWAIGGDPKTRLNDFHGLFGKNWQDVWEGFRFQIAHSDGAWSNTVFLPFGAGCFFFLHCQHTPNLFDAWYTSSKEKTKTFFKPLLGQMLQATWPCVIWTCGPA